MDVHTITKQDGPAQGRITRLTMAIYGLGCGGGGSLAVEQALRRVPGVALVYVDPATEMAYVQCRDELAHGDQLVRAVEDAGFGVGEVRIR